MITDLFVDVDARRQAWARGGGGVVAPLPGNVVKCFLCCIVLRKCRQLLGASPQTLTGDLWTPLGDFCPSDPLDLPHCPPPWKKIVRAPIYLQTTRSSIMGPGRGVPHFFPGQK